MSGVPVRKRSSCRRVVPLVLAIDALSAFVAVTRPSFEARFNCPTEMTLFEIVPPLATPRS